MHYSKEEKAMWLEDWHQSGKKAWAYAKENGLIPQTFCSWTKEITKTKPGFVEVPAKAIAPILPNQEIVIEKGEVKLHIPLGIGSSELRLILGMVGVAV